MKGHIKYLQTLDACEDAVAFAATCPSLKRAWETCPRPDWMLWLLGHVGFDNPRMFRLFACWCVRNTILVDGRKVWDLLTDKRSRDAVGIAERYAVGDASLEELAAARDAAWDAAGDAARDAAGAAARDAAWDAARDAQSDQLRLMVKWADVAKLIKEKKC